MFPYIWPDPKVDVRTWGPRGIQQVLVQLYKTCSITPDYKQNHLENTAKI